MTDNWLLGKHILIVEDEIFNQQILFKMLQPENPVLLTANDGIEALALIQEYPSIDLILLDIKMPNMNGYEAIKEIKKTHPEIPIIAQTAYVEDKNKIMNSGFDAFIAKPINKNSLFELIASFL
jgi:CheY-like chemotaxis protein